MAGADFGQGSGEGNQSSYHFLGRLAKLKKLPHSEKLTHRKAEVGGGGGREPKWAGGREGAEVGGWGGGSRSGWGGGEGRELKWGGGMGREPKWGGGMSQNVLACDRFLGRLAK